MKHLGNLTNQLSKQIKSNNAIHSELVKNG